MILEGVVTTVSASGVINVAPMGPHFHVDEDRFELRPFETSTTYRYLSENPCGVFHVTDDVLLIAKSAINQLKEMPDTVAAERINGFVLQDCCRWYEFKATEIPTNSARKTAHCSIVKSGRNRDFYGFNRAKHAVLEATIAVTRIDFLPLEEVQMQLSRAETIIEKTGGSHEIEAFDLLKKFVCVQRTGSV